jgi:HTH-type transcriptional regulator / antitoxin HipB
MRIYSIADVANTARGRRLDLGLTQAALAERTGISRKWIYQFESGKATAELGLVIRVLEALGLILDITAETADTSTLSQQTGEVNLDVLLERYTKK